MPTTVIVIFQAKPGRGGALSAWLLSKHAGLAAHGGFIDISIYRDARDPDRIVEVEHWTEAAAHRNMVESVDAQGGWDELGDLVVDEPLTMCLEPIEP
jgi:quinol monooxygenase YgiN